MPQLFPLFVDLTGRLCAVIGAGTVAERKIRSLLEAGAKVRVVAPEVQPAIESLAVTEDIELQRRPYEPADLDGVALAFAATNDPAVNAQVAADATARGIWVNVASGGRGAGTALLPAVHRRGEVTIAVSTGGASPALARYLRDELAHFLPDSLDDHLAAVTELRARLRSELHDSSARTRAWRSAIQAGLIEHLRNGDYTAAERVLSEAIRDASEP